MTQDDADRQGNDPAGAGAEAQLRAQAKEALRGRMRSVRRLLPAESVEARSARLCERLWALPELGGAALLAGYRAVHKEADVARALARAGARGSALALPRVDAARGIVLHLHAPGDPLVASALGIEEPSAQAPEVDPREVTAVFVPALALDLRGHRLGYGRGYYDRLLSQMPHAFKVGVAYDFQLLAELPNSASDVPVDCIVTDERTVRVTGR